MSLTIWTLVTHLSLKAKLLCDFKYLVVIFLTEPVVTLFWNLSKIRKSRLLEMDPRHHSSNSLCKVPGLQLEPVAFWKVQSESLNSMKVHNTFILNRLTNKWLIVVNTVQPIKAVTVDKPTYPEEKHSKELQGTYQAHRLKDVCSQEMKTITLAIIK